MKKSRIFSKIGLTLIAGFVFASLCFVSPIRAATVTNLVDFNNTSDLTNLFNPSTDPTFTNIGDSGIINSGAVNVPSGSNEIWTTKQGYSVSGVGDVYTLSAFFKNKENAGYGGFGFSNQDTNETDDIGAPATGVGMVFHGGGGVFTNNRVYTSAGVGWVPNLVIGNWYKMILEVTAKGSNTYDLKFQIWNSDSNGNLDTMKTEQTLNGVVNADLGGASVIHGYFSAAGSRIEKIDNFLIEIESVADVSTPTSNSTTSSNSTSFAPSCGDTKPFGAPDLFQINVNDTHATLYYTPLNNNVSNYFISYSEISNTFRYGTLTGQGQSSGVLSYTVNFLQPNTTYYFKVRGQNGCMPGDFSNELRITTREKGSTTLLPYYRHTTNL